MSAEHTPAEQAVAYVLGRIFRDARLAYLIGPGSEAYNKLTDVYAAMQGKHGAEYRQSVLANIRTEAVVSRDKYEAMEEAHDRLLDQLREQAA